MSELYDSLEDDKDEHKSSSCSLNGNNTASIDTIGRTSESDSTNRYSFFLNNNSNPPAKTNLLHLFQYSKAYPQPRFILPNIISGETEVVPSIEVDNEDLLEQGLQFNNDGSFTKSPRAIKEELPFIAREYRNLQLQKKKTYSLNKKIPVVQSQMKNVLTLADAVDSQMSTAQVLNTKKKRDSTEESKSGSSVFSKTNRTKTSKEAVPRCLPQPKGNYNLTDSMKEKLLQTNKGEQVLKKKDHSTKAKRDTNAEKSENSQKCKLSAVSRRKAEVRKPQNFTFKENVKVYELISDKKKLKNASQKISKHNSDILLNATKPKLNYWERYQLESGYNPLFLRHECKKVPDDTTRSNFGDSEINELPEVSSRVQSCDNLGRDDEEMFYKKLIERDKTLKKTHRSSRSESPFELLKLEQNSYQGQNEFSGRSNFKDKSIFIDMPAEGNNSVNTKKNSKKCSHYCSSKSSPNMSKVELALKARTYGYLANARNIFKLKAQSSLTERERKSKISGKMSASSNDSVSENFACVKILKQNSLPVNGFPVVKTDVLRKNVPRASASWCKTKQPENLDGSLKGFVLPQVNAAEGKGGKVNPRLLERINSCLVSPKV